MPTDLRTRTTEADVEDFLSDLRNLPDDLTRRAHLVEHWPHVPPNFWKRLTPSMICLMDAEQFVSVLTYADPVGEKATRRAMASA